MSETTKLFPWQQTTTRNTTFVANHTLQWPLAKEDKLKYNYLLRHVDCRDWRKKTGSCYLAECLTWLIPDPIVVAGNPIVLAMETFTPGCPCCCKSMVDMGKPADDGKPGAPIWGMYYMKRHDANTRIKMIIAIWYSKANQYKTTI